MSPFHPTKRDLLLVLVTASCFGLLLQFDFFTSSANIARGATWSGGAIDDRERVKGGDRWLESVETGARIAAMEKIAGMGEGRVKWGEDGAFQTEVLAHAPGECKTAKMSFLADNEGWTIFDQIYLWNGTWFIVSDKPSKVPLLRLMTSTGAEIWNSEDSIAGREPTDKDMKIIFPSEAKKLWGHSASRVSGTTWLVNDPPQFLDHYYQ